MATDVSVSAPPATAYVRFQPFPAFLSYLVPGLGQIVQGRVSKGLLFLICIYGLFFYGMYLDHWKNVYLPRATSLPSTDLTWRRFQVSIPKPIGYRAQFLGQFWVGVAAWPAIIQMWSYDEDKPDTPPHPYLGTFMRTPSETELNLLQTRGNKTWDLGWVYTVIAGVLNIMVIYDALAGPAFPKQPGRRREDP